MNLTDYNKTGIAEDLKKLIKFKDLPVTQPHTILNITIVGGIYRETALSELEQFVTFLPKTAKERIKKQLYTWQVRCCVPRGESRICSI